MKQCFVLLDATFEVLTYITMFHTTMTSVYFVHPSRYCACFPALYLYFLGLLRGIAAAVIYTLECDVSHASVAKLVTQAT